MITREQGLQQIQTAAWTKDEYGILNLRVQNEQGLNIHAWLSLRPIYCDRGHIYPALHRRAARYRFRGQLPALFLLV